MELTLCAIVFVDLHLTLTDNGERFITSNCTVFITVVEHRKWHRVANDEIKKKRVET